MNTALYTLALRIVLTAILAACVISPAKAGDDCSQTYAFKICVGQTIKPFQPLAAAMAGNNDPTVASAGINGGSVEITGLKEGTTMVTVAFTGYDNKHQQVRCRLVLNITVVKCEGNKVVNGGNSGSSGSGSASGSGTEYKYDSLNRKITPQPNQNRPTTYDPNMYSPNTPNTLQPGNCNRTDNYTINQGEVLKWLPKNPALVSNSDPSVASATVSGGAFEIRGLKKGTTTIVMQMDAYDNNHQLVRCTVTMVITVR